MSIKALINACALTPNGYKNNQSVLVEDGIITMICDDADRPSEIAIAGDLDGMKLVPGFIDLQVNGGGGVLFNDNPTVEAIKVIGAAHRRFGTTGFFPTLISDDPAVMRQAINAVEQAIAQGVPGVLGIHLEGPYLNPKKRGVHDTSKFMRMGEEELDLISSLQGGKTIVTLAPEMTTPEMIQTLSRRGVIVSAGHTMATYQETLAALDAGLTGFTHLFNAMGAINSRHPGVITAALEDPRGWCGIIADGHHVHPAILRLAMRAKQNEQIFLVTDAMPSVGAEHKPFSLGAMNIEVKNGQCVTFDGTLAGSDLDMMSAVRNAMEFFDIDLAQAVCMASIIPARFIQMQDRIGQIRPGLQANFLLLSTQNEVVQCWIDGQALL